MKKINSNDKAQQLFDNFKILFIAESDGINSEMANTAALICTKVVIDELDFYAGSNLIQEIRPYDLSGKGFWDEVQEKLRKYRYESGSEAEKIGTKCTKPNCDCLEKEEKKQGGMVKNYPCLAVEKDQLKSEDQNMEERWRKAWDKSEAILKNKTT